MLSREQLKLINNRMVNKGAPVKSDNRGYNRLDYPRMMEYTLKDWNNLTDGQLYYVARVLNKYKNTQLIQYKSDIEETMEYYKPQNTLTVLNTTDQSVQIIWNFSKCITDRLKGKLDKQQYDWTKHKHNWVLKLNWSYVDKFTQIMESLKIDCSQLRQLIQPVLF